VKAAHLLHGPFSQLILGHIVDVGQLECGMSGDLFVSSETGPRDRLTSCMNFSLSASAFSDPCRMADIFRMWKGGLTRSWIVSLTHSSQAE